VFCWNVMVRQFKIRPLTSRQRAHLEEQRLRNVTPEARAALEHRTVI
jgi:hypothetical protein